MLSTDAFARIYRLSAWYDMAVTWPYATPFTLALAWQWLDSLHGGLGLSPMPPLSVYGTLFANFFGTVVLVWSVARLWLNDPRLARVDALGRWLFTAWMLTALMSGASPFLWGFVAAEATFGTLQSLPVSRAANLTA